MNEQTIPAIDLSVTHFDRRRGDIRIIGTWWREDGRHEPCLILMREADHGRAPEGVQPCRVLLSNAWIYDEQKGSPEEAAWVCAGFVDALGLSRNYLQVMRVRSIIHDHLGDLLTIPPRPPVESRVVAEATIRDRQTGRRTELEVLDDA